MSGIAWAVAGSVVGAFIFMIMWIRGLTNKVQISVEEEYQDYAKAMEDQRKADSLLDDAEYRKQLFNEDNKD